MMDNGIIKMEWITPPLLDAIRAEYQMDWNGIHGYAHWCRVRENGLVIARENGANRKVVELFAFTHDCMRRNDGDDPQHGLRASLHIKAKLIDYIDLTPEELGLLCTACELHTIGRTEADVTIQTCWDADRLDLMRVGIMPQKFYLCTEVARRDEVIRSAMDRSCKWANDRYHSIEK